MVDIFMNNLDSICYHCLPLLHCFTGPSKVFCRPGTCENCFFCATLICLYLTNSHFQSLKVRQRIDDQGVVALAVAVSSIQIGLYFFFTINAKVR